MSKFPTKEELEVLVDEWLEENAKYQEIKDNQYVRFHEKFTANEDNPYSFWNFKRFVNAVIDKYNSPAYIDKFFTKDREHYGSVPEDLLFFLYNNTKNMFCLMSYIGILAYYNISKIELNFRLFVPPSFIYAILCGFVAGKCTR